MGIVSKRQKQAVVLFGAIRLVSYLALFAATFLTHSGWPVLVFATAFTAGGASAINHAAKKEAGL